MASKSYAIGAIPAALLIAFSAGGPVTAQTTTTSTDLNTVTVVAPRITYKIKREGGSAIPREITLAEKTALVTFGDLDLTRTADLYTLEGRVGAAAARVCEELAQDFPDGEPSTSVCTRRATDDAMAQLRTVARATLGSKP